MATNYQLRAAAPGEAPDRGEWLAYTAWVAEATGQTIGYLAYRVTAGEGEVLHVEVRPEWRRQGVGRALIVQTRREAPVWHLEVRESNAAARALYEQLGFQEVGRRRGYYGDGETAVLMRWGL